MYDIPCVLFQSHPRYEKLVSYYSDTAVNNEKFVAGFELASLVERTGIGSEFYPI